MSTIIYNAQGLFVGPSGANFQSYTGGEPVFDYSDPAATENLIKQIDRVQALSYDITLPHTQVTQFNTRSVVDRPIINSPEVSFSFSYLISDVSNEEEMGLFVNYAQFEEPSSGAPFFSNNTGQSLISGFAVEDETSSDFKDKKNYYLAINDKREDLFTGTHLEDLTKNSSSSYEIDFEAPNHKVICFGNCYMVSYSIEASVGAFPRAEVSFVAENIMFETSGSGFLSPTIETKSGAQINNLNSVIPNRIDKNPISVVRPGDINFTTDSFSGLGVDFNNLHLESYVISFDIPRGAETNLGYKFPLSRKLTYPIPVSIDLNGIVEKMSSGSLIDLVNLNQDYNFSIDLNMPSQTCTTTTTGIKHASAQAFEDRNIPLIKYTLNKAKLNSFTYDSSIGSNKTFSASFSTELDPDDLTRGLFISGLIGQRKLEDFHLLEGGDNESFYLLLEDESGIIVDNASRIPVRRGSARPAG